MLWTIAIYLLLLGLALLAAYSYYMSKKHGMLQKLGIPGPTPWPILGTMIKETKNGMFQYHVEAYRKYKGQKAYCGYFGRIPIIYPRDLDVIRDICVKQFHHFTNRNVFELGDPIDHALTNLKDDQWKRVRSTISPTFSSGKLKRMVSLIQENSQHLVQYLREKQESNEEVELKDCMGRFSMDTIASTGFGVSINSFTEKDNQFTIQGKRLIQEANNAGLVGFFLDFLWPVIRRVTNLAPKESLNFFSAFVDQTLNRRKEETAKRNDFVQLVLEAQTEEGEEGKKTLTYNEIQGQAIVFIFAGYDTTSAVLSFTAFLLAMNPDCCRKVQEEIDEILQGEIPDYENVQKLTYLDMCVNEAMRMYPPGFLLDRICSEEVEIQGVKFPKDVLVLIPVCGIHNDPEMYPEPEKFIPERFTAEEKEARHPYAFLPFGQGPRNCIGMRLALMTLKIGLASVLQVMTPVTCERSEYPVKLKTVLVEAKDGLWVKFERRNK